VKINVELVRAADGTQLWSESYNVPLADIFDIQEEMARQISATIEPELAKIEQQLASRKSPGNLDAWECYQRGIYHFQGVNLAENLKARGFLQRAADLDPQFVRAHAMLCATYIREANMFRPDLRAENVALAIACSRRAVALDPTDSWAHATLAIALTAAGQHEEGIAEGDFAATLDPNCYHACLAQGYTRLPAGRARDAIEPLRIGMRLNPFGLGRNWLVNLARAHYLAGEYEAAVAVARQARRTTPNFQSTYVTLMAALGQLGRAEEARTVMVEALEHFGDSIRYYFMSSPPHINRERRPEDAEHLINGLRKAGIVE